MANEIELKLRIRAADIPRLRHHPTVQAALVGKAVTRRLTSIYYDTPDLALLDADLSLRVRRMSGGWFQAVKGAGHSLAGLHQRMEWEDIIAHGEPDFSKITDPALTQVFDDPDLRAALQPIFTTDVRRTEWQLQPAPECAIEMALDQGQLIAGEHREPICEVELELKSGQPLHLFELALALQADIPLWIENISKAQRGYARYRPMPPDVRHAKDIDLAPGMTPAQACRRIVWECLAHLQGNHEAVLHARQGEGVHQMRVALRRLRSAMSLFAAFMPPARQLREEIRWLAATLGETRDLDVLLHTTLPPVLEALDHAGLAQLQKRARQALDGAWERTTAALESQRYQRLLLALGVWMETSAPGMEGMTLEMFAGDVLARRQRQLQKRGMKYADHSAEERHEFRISAKKLRYAAEFLASLYRSCKTRRYTRRLSRLTSVLGNLNDLAVTDALLETLSGPRPSRPLHEARLLIKGWNARQAEVDIVQLQRAWKRFARATHFWR